MTDTNDATMQDIACYGDIGVDKNIVEVVVNKEIIVPKNEVEKNDWSNYNPTMMKAPMSAALRQSILPTFQATSKISSFQLPEPSENMHPTVTETPQLTPNQPKINPQKGEKKDLSRRKPVLTTSASETLLEARVSALRAAKVDASEEHKIQIRILKLQEQQEIEKLKQEKMKTEILKIQLQRKSQVEWVFDGDDETQDLK